MLLCLMYMFRNYLMAFVMIYSGVCVHSHNLVCVSVVMTYCGVCVHGLGFLLLEHFICVFISYLFMLLNL